MYVDNVIAQIEAEIPDLNSRTEGAAELSELLRQGTMPQSPLAAFVLPLGIRGRGDGEAGTGYFVQSIDEVVGILVVVRNAGDTAGSKALPTIEAIVDQLILHLVGWAPDSAAIGVFRMVRGNLVSAQAGTVIFQLDIAIQKQIRNL